MFSRRKKNIGSLWAHCKDSFKMPILFVSSSKGISQALSARTLMGSRHQEIYVAVGRDMLESVSALKWVLHNNPAGSLILLHVKPPITAIPSPIGKIPVHRVCKNVLNAHKEDEKKKLNDCMEFYAQICSQANVRAEALIVEKEDVCRGIVQVVSELGITKLIMGKRSTKSRIQVKDKAGYVIRHAINSCDISIVCGGKLVAAREGSVLDNDDLGQSVSFQSNIQRDLAASIETRANFPIGGHCMSDLPDKLNKSRLETPPSNIDLEFCEYPLEDIKAATGNFSNHSKLGGGGYGTVYKGQIGHATVAVKIVGEDSFQGWQEFQREIDILRDIRHPNLVKVVGACFEQGCILYEYMTNGSLADRLSCKDSTPPLPWQTRIRIAAEVCSGLQFLHSSETDPVVHHDLKPENILLDENYVSKISDFGLACRLHRDLHKESEPKGTFAYMDPEYLRSGEYSTKSDVYSLGIIFLQLLTGKPALGVLKEVECALKKGKLDEVLDPSAGEWPFAQAKQLADLALHCTEPVRKKRPDIQPTVMHMLDELRKFTIAATEA